MTSEEKRKDAVVGPASVSLLVSRELAASPELPVAAAVVETAVVAVVATNSVDSGRDDLLCVLGLPEVPEEKMDSKNVRLVT